MIEGLSDRAYFRREAKKLPPHRRHVGPLGQLIRRTLRQINPELMSSLQEVGVLASFLMVEGAKLQDQLDNLARQGVAEPSAREQVLTEFLQHLGPQIYDDEEYQAMEQEEEEENAEAVVGAWLATMP